MAAMDFPATDNSSSLNRKTGWDPILTCLIPESMTEWALIRERRDHSLNRARALSPARYRGLSLNLDLDLDHNQANNSPASNQGSFRNSSLVDLGSDLVLALMINKNCLKNGLNLDNSKCRNRDLNQANRHRGRSPVSSPKDLSNLVRGHKQGNNRCHSHSNDLNQDNKTRINSRKDRSQDPILSQGHSLLANQILSMNSPWMGNRWTECWSLSWTPASVMICPQAPPEIFLSTKEINFKA